MSHWIRVHVNVGMVHQRDAWYAPWEGAIKLAEPACAAKGNKQHLPKWQSWIRKRTRNQVLHLVQVGKAPPFGTTLIRCGLIQLRLMGVHAVNLLLKELILILELLDALTRRIEFLLRGLKVAMEVRNDSSRLATGGHSQALFLAELGNLATNLLPTAARRCCNFGGIAGATEGLPDLPLKEGRDLHAVPYPLLSALANGAGRGLTSDAFVVKTNEAAATRKTWHCIMLACNVMLRRDGGAPRDLLLVLCLEFLPVLAHVNTSVASAEAQQHLQQRVIDCCMFV